MKDLIHTLKNQTLSLKEQYIEMTGEWAREEFKRYKEQTKWTVVQWCEFLRITPDIVTEENKTLMRGVGVYFPKGFYNTKSAGTYDRASKKAFRIAAMGEESFVSSMRENAEIHYENSIEKLALRIEKKGLDQDNLSVVTSHIGVNIETTLTDGEKTVRAFTIIAGGPVQKPHYRYLIK